MSLKHLHLFFIASALGMLAFTAYACVSHVQAGENGGAKFIAAASIVTFLGGLGYLRWFVRKHGI